MVAYAQLAHIAQLSIICKIWVFNATLAESGKKGIRKVAPIMTVDAVNDYITTMICQEEQIMKIMKIQGQCSVVRPTWSGRATDDERFQTECAKQFGEITVDSSWYASVKWWNPEPCIFHTKKEIIMQTPKEINYWRARKN